jgi:AcrR family transcriptional regulator
MASTTGDALPDKPSRRRGRPPTIRREQIVAAARDLLPGELTMQSIADALGVSRKALHYYVGDRQGLLSLVVIDRFESELARVQLPDGGEWQAVLRSYARAFRSGLIDIGVAIEHSPFQGAAATAALTLADRVLDALLTAGFQADDARLGLTTLANIAQTAARTTIWTSGGQHDYGAETIAALQDTSVGEYPALRRAFEAGSPSSTAQFEFDLDIVIAGLEARLDARRA